MTAPIRWVCPSCGKVEVVFVAVKRVSHACPMLRGEASVFEKETP